MPSSDNRAEVSEPNAEIGTVMTSVNLLDVKALCEALLRDLSNGAFDDVYRTMGLARVTWWIGRDPDAAVTMWEGSNIDELLEGFGTSRHPLMAKWRGLLRIWSGPEEANGFWEASRHRLLSWATEEEGAESEVMVFQDPRQVEMYRQQSLDFQQDPSLRRLLDRVRREQGFTRIETWHQRTSENDTVLTLVEAHDLKAAVSRFMSEDNELDRRLMDLMRKTILQGASPPPAAKLLARWRA